MKKQILLICLLFLALLAGAQTKSTYSIVEQDSLETAAPSYPRSPWRYSEDSLTLYRWVADSSAWLAVWSATDIPSGSGTVESVVAGTGINVDNTDPANPIIQNTAQDQTITIGDAGTVTVSGSYPNFTVTGDGISPATLSDSMAVVRDSLEDLRNDIGSGSGASTFTDLTDSPASYSGQANKMVLVSSGETGLIFADTAGLGSGGGSANLTGTPYFIQVSGPNARYGDRALITANGTNDHIELAQALDSVAANNLGELVVDGTFTWGSTDSLNLLTTVSDFVLRGASGKALKDTLKVPSGWTATVPMIRINAATGDTLNKVVFKDLVIVTLGVRECRARITNRGYPLGWRWTY